MKAPKLHITSARMLSLIEHMIETAIARTQGEACELIGLNQANIRKVKAGDNKFTVDQIEAACKLTGASADYVFGFTNVMKRVPAKKPIEMLREVVKALELNGK